MNSRSTQSLAAYRRLLKRGRFIQPSSGKALLSRVKARVNPWTTFMDTYWNWDPLGEGTLCCVFDAAFRH
jgi:hypothetical protein